jgi:cytochrome c551/c552
LKAANIDVKNIQVYNLLLDRGADVNAKGRNNATALMYAAKSGNIELVKLLLDREADINAKDGDTVTALMYAANSGNIELVKMLLDKGADINARIVSNDVKSNGLTALRIASAKGNAEIVKLLKEKGAVENTENRITVGDSAAPQPKQMNSMYVLAMINRAKMYCFTCHSINKRVVGPAWRDVAAKYRGVTDANARLVAKVSQGGSGVWGTMPMPPNAPKVPEQDIKLLVQFILNL